MRVAVYYNNTDVRLEDRPIPKIAPNEILVRVVASGICGSDVLEWYRIKKAPLVLGHEMTGEIVEAGKNVERYKVGDRVFVSHHIPCNTCRRPAPSETYPGGPGSHIAFHAYAGRKHTLPHLCCRILTEAVPSPTAAPPPPACAPTHSQWFLPPF